MRRWMLAFLIVGLAVGLLPQPAAAQAATVPHLVQPNETLSAIARRYCTTWQEIYSLNRHVIGPSPHYLRSGIVIRVPNRCGGVPPSGGVYDRGPRPHAQGARVGNVYTVAPGDTLFSIGQRFGVAVASLAAANGIAHPWRIVAGQRLVIPGL